MYIILAPFWEKFHFHCELNFTMIRCKNCEIQRERETQVLDKKEQEIKNSCIDGVNHIGLLFSILFPFFFSNKPNLFWCLFVGRDLFILVQLLG